MCKSDLHPKAHRLESMGEKCRVHVGFIYMEKGYDRVNREALWKVLIMCNVGGKLLNGIKSIYVKRM